MKNYRLILIIALLLSLRASAERSELPFECTPFHSQALSGPIWDATSLGIVDDDGYGFIYSNSNGFITEYTVSDAEHYLMRGDSLIFRGYTRGRNLGALVDSLTHVLRFPLETGDSIVSVYSLSGSIEGHPIFRDEGTVNCEVLRKGVFIFAPGDTVPAILVHEQRNCNTYTKDSMTCNTDDFWRWYYPDSRIPFALQFKQSEEQSARLFLTDRFQGHVIKRKGIETEKDSRQSIIDRAEVTVSEFEVTVILGSIPDVEAEVYIVDIAGNIYGHTVRPLDRTSNEFHISLSGIQRNGCMLVMTLNGTPPLTNKRLLQL